MINKYSLIVYEAVCEGEMEIMSTTEDKSLYELEAKEYEKKKLDTAWALVKDLEGRK